MSLLDEESHSIDSNNTLDLINGRSLRIHIGTYNLATKKPNRFDLGVWLEDFLWFGGNSLFEIISGKDNPIFVIDDGRLINESELEPDINDFEDIENEIDSNIDITTSDTNETVDLLGNNTEQSRSVFRNKKGKRLRNRAKSIVRSPFDGINSKSNITMNQMLNEPYVETPFDDTSPYSKAALGAVQGYNSPDIYFYGFQELASQPNLFTWKKPLTDIWIPSLLNKLNVMHKKKKYKCIAKEQMVAIGGCILISNEIKVQNIYIGSIGSGFLGIYGNKGAVGIGIDLEFNGNKTSILFLSIHLKAHAGEKYYNHRKQEFNYILAALNLYNELDSEDIRSVSDFDSLFVCGDTNFRLFCDGKWKNKSPSIGKPSPSKDLVRIMDPLDAIPYYKDNDELSYLIKGDIETDKSLIPIFREQNLNTFPSYKYRIGTNVFNTNRGFAWPDRVFYAHSFDKRIVECGYRVVNCSFSDHLPMVSSFKISLNYPDKGIHDNQIKQIKYYLNNIHSKYPLSFLFKNKNIRSYVYQLVRFLMSAGPLVVKGLVIGSIGNIIYRYL